MSYDQGGSANMTSNCPSGNVGGGVFFLLLSSVARLTCLNARSKLVCPLSTFSMSSAALGLLFSLAALTIATILPILSRPYPAILAVTSRVFPFGNKGAESAPFCSFSFSSSLGGLWPMREFLTCS